MSTATLLTFASLAAVAVVVFAIVPRFTTAPVVTTAPGLRPDSLPSITAPPARTSVEPVPSSPAPTALSSFASPPVELSPVIPAPSPPDDFEARITEGLAALERGAPAEARAAFEQAEAMRPGTGAVKDGLARADAGLRAEALAGHRRRAEAAEAEEHWRGALQEYEQALRMEPAVRFAVEGAARARQRAQIADRLEGYLERPDRLSTEAVAEEAEAALERAGALDPAGPRLLTQVAELRRLLTTMRTAVTVRLLSDERTEVSVLRVGALGRFREKTLELRPGTYVVTGTRAGYRDVRQTLVVPPGRSPAPLEIRCHEAL